MKKKILYGIIAIIILAGIIMFCIHGFNIGNIYGSYTKIGLYMENGVNKDEITQIVQESFNGKEAIMQDIEYFGEMVLITLPTVSDEEIDNFIAKVNEKYSLDYGIDDLDILNMPGLTFAEVINPYILPVALSVLISIVYIAIRYHSLGIMKMIGKSIISIIIVQAIVLSLYLILNLPIDLSIVPVTLVGLGISLLYTTSDNNKLLEIQQAQKEEEE